MNLQPTLDKDYLCRCNHCNIIMIDMNPQTNAVLLDIPEDVEQMEYIEDEDGIFFYGCPSCLDDADLMDLDKLPDTKLRTYHRNPTAYEIKFGEGAIHYRDFTASEIGFNNRGELKKWFKADDGLRYYY